MGVCGTFNTPSRAPVGEYSNKIPGRRRTVSTTVLLTLHISSIVYSFNGAVSGLAEPRVGQGSTQTTVPSRSQLLCGVPCSHNPVREEVKSEDEVTRSHWYFGRSGRS